ncbi:hypothetical protein ACFQ1M_11605 [Sungkyunkwania multivorans]|uniref:Uncharacterized protein n=1 Tax=Sungkyunkwania multivorans TaxID=1173618 RepID=A0ABW3D153_9FLAO
MSSETNQQIKNRMIKKAASLWGVSPNEINSSFDPIVALLIGACASEIEKISGELNESQTRITERLIQLMTPETIYGSKPAHAIAYASPVDASMNITPEHLLYYKKKDTSKNARQEINNIYFSPVQTFKLMNASVVYMLAKGQLFEVGGKMKTGSKLHFKDRKEHPKSTIYLGLKADSTNISLKGTSLYFELQDIEKTELFYHHLKNASFHLNGKALEVKPGYVNSGKSDMMSLAAIFDYKPNKTRNIENQVKEIYKQYFISFTSEGKLKKEGKIPDELKDLIDLEQHEDFESLNWLKITFPRILNDSILENIYCSFNAFPVLNRKWESFSYQLKDFIDIVPIDTMSLFLDIKSVSSTSGKLYKLRENDSSEDHKGTFVLRQNNIGKLDSRRAKEHITHFIELLKDESASFSFLGNDFLQSNINELNQIISLLEKKVAETGNRFGDTHYISVTPYKKRETLLIDYWTTNGADANNVKSGSPLSIYQGSAIRQKSAMLLTTSMQGKDNLSMDERLNAYRRALLSRNRIVTKEDIKALCYELCGDKVERIETRKGFKTDLDTHKGLIPCVEVILHSSKKVNKLDVEWEVLKNNILSTLNQQSLNIFAYKITVV